MYIHLDIEKLEELKREEEEYQRQRLKDLNKKKRHQDLMQFHAKK